MSIWCWSALCASKRVFLFEVHTHLVGNKIDRLEIRRFRDVATESKETYSITFAYKYWESDDFRSTVFSIGFENTTHYEFKTSAHYYKIPRPPPSREQNSLYYFKRQLSYFRATVKQNIIPVTTIILVIIVVI